MLARTYGGYGSCILLSMGFLGTIAPKMGAYMKIIYIANEKSYSNSGVNKKIAQQVVSLNRINGSTNLVQISNECSTVKHSHTPSEIKPLSKSVCASLNKLSSYFSVDKKIRSMIRSADKGVVFYIRYPLTPIYGPLSFMRSLRKCKIVLEMNTILLTQYSTYDRCAISLVKMWEKMFGDFVVKNADGLVGVTDEITDYYAARSHYGPKHITVENGIDNNLVRLRSPPPFNGRSLKLLTVANISKWHAFDRLIKGVADYSGPVEIELHIVGDGLAKENLMKLAEKLNIQSKIHFHGFLSGDELDRQFSECHIAIGSLGLHRNGLREATPLKSREYCARGIPFIKSYIDPDFPDGFPYVLNCPPDDSNIDVTSIVDFAERTYKGMDHNVRMRDYAIKCLDWNVKMQKLDKFLRSL